MRGHKRGLVASTGAAVILAFPAIAGAAPSHVQHAARISQPPSGGLTGTRGLLPLPGVEPVAPPAPLRATARLRNGTRPQQRTSLGAALAAAPTPPFADCPAVGGNSSCALLIDVTNANTTVYSDPSQGPFDGSDDTLIGVRNDSGSTLDSIHLSSGTAPLFGFDGDGLCSFGVVGCPFGATGYEGPGTSFANISASENSGDVVFSPGLAPGASAYFSLEAPLDATAVVTGGPSAGEQGGAPNGSERSTTCSSPAPVNCATGVFWHSFTDASVPGLGVPLRFTRTYESSAAAVDGPLGFGWTFSYGMRLSFDGAGDATVLQEDGSTISFHDTGSGWSAPPWVLATLVDNGDGTYTLAREATHVSYRFDSTGQLVSEQDRNGHPTTLGYDGSGNLTSVTDPAGRTLTLAYGGGHLDSITDPMGRTTSFSYDAAGNLASTTDPLGRTWTFTYDSSHLLLSMTDPRGGTTANTYDGTQRVVQQVDPAGRTTTWSYSGDPSSATGGATVMTDPRGIATEYDYANMELSDVIRALGTADAAETSYQYDPATLGVSRLIDPAGDVTTTTYDARGDVTSTTNALGQTRSYSYDADGNLLSATDPLGVTTTYTYDPDGNRTSESKPLYETGQTATTAFQYGTGAAAGELLSTTDPTGAETTYGYDAAGNRTSVTDPLGNQTTAAYDADGHRLSTTSPAGNAGGDPAAHTTTYGYDADGELTSVEDPLGHTWTRTYDGDGNEIQAVDPDGHAVRYGYDADNERIQRTRADGTMLQTAYDAAGNAVGQTDGAGRRTTYALDALNRVVGVTDPLGHTTTYHYNAAGNLTTLVDPMGRTTTYGYDAAGELLSIGYSDQASANVQQFYDADGRRTFLSDGSGTSSFTYDSLGRLISQVSGNGLHVGYSYDLRGDLTGIQYPNDQTVARTYDAAGRLTGVDDWLGNHATFAYDADGNPVGEQLPGSVTSTTTYDGADRLTGITDANAAGAIASFSYVQDPAGQVTSDRSTGVAASDHAYAYDTVGRLTADGRTSFGYDAADDPTTFGDGQPQSFDDAGAVLSSGTQSTPPPPPPPPPPPGPNMPTVPGAPATPGPSSRGGSQAGPPPAPDGNGSVDAIVGARHRRGLGTLRTAPLTTSHAGDLLLALVSLQGPRSRGQSVRTVTGGGLRWHRLERSTSRGGASSVWWAQAPSRLTHVRVAIRARVPGYPALATVVAFVPGTAIGVHAHASGRSGAPRLRLATPPDATIWTVGHDAAAAARRTPLAGTALIQQLLGPGRSTSWVQRATAADGPAVGEAAPRSTSWSLAAVAISPPATSAGAASRHPHATVDALAGSAGERRTFSYDADGDRTGVTAEDGTITTLAHDQAGRLVGVGSSVGYAYDGDGLRTSATANGVVTQFAWDRSSTTPLLLQASDGFYVYGPGGQAIEQVQGGTATFLLHDRQGSTRVLTDQQGDVVGGYRYDAWGATIAHSGSATTQLQYDGQYADPETGFLYLRARVYDPSTGQFLTPDPADAQTRSRYVYAEDDPTSLSDPLGLFAVGTCTSVSGTVVDGGGASGTVVTCVWKGYDPSFTATTVTGSVGVGLGLEDGSSGQVHFTYSGASSPQALAGQDCSVGASGHLFLGIGLSAGGCSGPFSLDLSLDAGLDGGASATGGWGATCVTASSNGYTGCGDDGQAPVSSHPLCDDQAYSPYRDIA